MKNAFLIGWVQILAIVGLIDVFNLQTEPIKYLGDYELFGTFGMLGGGSNSDIGSHHHGIRFSTGEVIAAPKAHSAWSQSDRGAVRMKRLLIQAQAKFRWSLRSLHSLAIPRAKHFSWM